MLARARAARERRRVRVQDGGGADGLDAGAHVLLLFGARHCDASCALAPALAARVAACRARGRRVEVVYVSCDRDEASCAAFAALPELARLGCAVLPYAERRAKGELCRRFGVRASSLPALVVLGPAATAGPAAAPGERPLVSRCATRALLADAPRGDAFPWKERRVEDLAKTGSCGGFDLHEKPSLVLFCEGVTPPAARARLRAALEAVAEGAARDGAERARGPAAICFVADASEAPVVARMRQLCKLPAAAEPEPTLVLLDIPDNGGFYVCAERGALDESAMRAFLSKYESGALAGERRQLG